MKTKIEKTYIADDGEEFKSKADCLDHEEKVKRGGIFFMGREITEEYLRKEILREYFLTNYSPNRLSIFARVNGGCYGEIYGAVANRLGKIYDSWNYGVHKRRGNI